MNSSHPTASVRGYHELIRGFARCFERDPRDWWFTPLMRDSWFPDDPSMLSGTEVGAWISVDCGAPELPRVAAQPSTAMDLDALTRAVARSPGGEGTLAALAHVGWPDAPWHTAFGATLHRGREVARAYVLARDLGGAAHLQERVFGSVQWCPRPRGAAAALIDRLSAAGTLVGAARRTAGKARHALYFQVLEDATDAHLLRIAGPLGAWVVDGVRAFLRGVVGAHMRSGQWGWAVVLDHRGDLAYVKLELTDVVFEHEDIVPTDCSSLVTWRWLEALVADSGFRTEPNALSCRIIPAGISTTAYYGVTCRAPSTRDDAGDHRLRYVRCA